MSVLRGRTHVGRRRRVRQQETQRNSEAARKAEHPGTRGVRTSDKSVAYPRAAGARLFSKSHLSYRFICFAFFFFFVRLLFSPRLPPAVAAFAAARYTTYNGDTPSRNLSSLAPDRVKVYAPPLIPVVARRRNDNSVAAVPENVAERKS